MFGKQLLEVILSGNLVIVLGWEHAFETTTPKSYFLKAQIVSQHFESASHRNL